MITITSFHMVCTGSVIGGLTVLIGGYLAFRTWIRYQVDKRISKEPNLLDKFETRIQSVSVKYYQ